MLLFNKENHFDSNAYQIRNESQLGFQNEKGKTSCLKC